MTSFWRCPKCGADAHMCGKGECLGGGGKCEGLLCECWESRDATDVNEAADPSSQPDHGTSASPCSVANCYHCGWGGQMRVKIPPPDAEEWEIKALAAGWKPPKGWGKKVPQSYKGRDDR